MLFFPKMSFCCRKRKNEKFSCKNQPGSKKNDILKGEEKEETMIQLITFLIAQLIFVPVYLLTTDICTGRNGKWIHKVILILISPFAAYLYINFFLGFISVVLPEETLDKILSASDIIVISLSFLFMKDMTEKDILVG